MSWLEPLVDPRHLVALAYRDQANDPRVGLALLLEARILDYQRRAEKSGWPAIGKPVRRGARLDERLVAAAGLQLAGDAGAEREYLHVMRGRNPELAVVATILLSIHLADQGRLANAVEVLQRRLRRENALTAALLGLHLGVRLGEEGDWGAAHASTEAARRVARAAKPAEWRRVLDTIARLNLLAFKMKLRAPMALDWPARSDIPALTRGDLLAADGLAAYLDSAFQSALDDPYTPTVRFQAQDSTETNLQGALIRAECLADWHELKRARRLLGRYQVLSKLGTPTGFPPSVFELLRRGGDNAALRAAARISARVGPLRPLQLATAGIVDRVAVGDEVGANLILLAAGADLLGEQEAMEAFERLTANPGVIYDQWPDSPRVLAELAKSAPTEAQTRFAKYTRSLIETAAGHPGLVDRLAVVPAAIRWGKVEDGEREAWWSFVASNLASKRGGSGIAEQALFGLARIDEPTAAGLLADLFATSPNLRLVALGAQALTNPPAWAKEQGWSFVEETLASIRTDAARGAYGFGDLDVGSLAVALLKDKGGSQRWRELIDFLVDPAVAIGAKSGAFDAIANGRPRIPTKERLRLKESLSSVTGANHLTDSPEKFQASRLRLAAALRALPRSELITSLLDLAGAQSALARIQAGLSVPRLQTQIGRDVASTIVLILSRDPHHDVRAAAGRALSQVDNGHADRKAWELTQRLVQLLDEPGRDVPAAAIAGLIQTVRAGGAVSTDVEVRVERLGAHHLSRTVRTLAAEFADAQSPEHGRRPPPNHPASTP